MVLSKCTKLMQLDLGEIVDISVINSLNLLTNLHSLALYQKEALTRKKVYLFT